VATDHIVADTGITVTDDLLTYIGRVNCCSQGSCNVCDCAIVVAWVFIFGIVHLCVGDNMAFRENIAGITENKKVVEFTRCSVVVKV